MVMTPGPIVRAVNSIRERDGHARVILLSPRGRVFNQRVAGELSGLKHIVLICGRYEGVDERVIERTVDEELSIGDYVLSGGEPAALVVLDAVSRLIPGVLGCRDSASEDSFSDGLLEHPHYTRPREFMGLSVPEVLLSGDHRRIARWRRKQSLKMTLERRPELFESADLDENDREFLREILEDPAGREE